MTETVEFLGERFSIAERVAALPLMRFAKVARSGTQASDMEGLAALYDLLEQCVHPDDWDRFQAHAERQRADGEQLLTVVQEVFALLAERPTGRSTASSDGPQIIEPSSMDDSSSPGMEVVRRLNEQGRPDLALLVRKRQESLSA